MGSPLNSLSNSPGLAIATDLLDSCITILRKAPPLSQTGSQSVTSLIDIKPQDTPPVPSKFSPYLIAAGAAALLATAFIVVRVAIYYFSSPKPDAPASDSAAKPTPSTTPPTDPNAAKSGQRTAPLSGEPKPSSHPPSSPQGSPPDSRSESSSSSVPESPQLPPKSPTKLQQFTGSIAYYLTAPRHFSKWFKYRFTQDQYEDFTYKANAQAYTTGPDDLKLACDIATAWNAFLKALIQPATFETADDQYRETVSRLCETLQLLHRADDETKKKFATQHLFADGLSYLRYVGIELYPYLCELTVLVTGMALPENLSLENFIPELKKRIEVLKDCDTPLLMNPIAREWNKAKGHLNIGFNPLLRTIPYQDGRLTVNEMSTIVLWHAVPVTHHDPYGLMFDLTTGLLKYIPLFGRFVPKENPVSAPPTINADYVAFIEEAARKGEKILHVILENGEKKSTVKGDESTRVKARLRLGVYHPNFYDLALRLDGKFFKREDFEGPESIQHLKDRFKAQLLMPLKSFENEGLTASVATAKQYEDQLSITGFCVPEKLREASELPKYIDQLLVEVQNIYFSGVADITTQEEHQAFLLFSYVHIILFICYRMKINILEALCKDDKDRGNLIKTLLKLHFLYLTGQITKKTLTQVFVHVLARNIIMQKNGIIESRLVLLEQAIPFIVRAFARVTKPNTTIFGESIKNASYVVTSPKGQILSPTKNSAKNLE